jgi:hypothetical protein
MSVFRYHDQEQIPSGRLPGFGADRVSPPAHRPDVAVTAVPFAVARAGHRAPH